MRLYDEKIIDDNGETKKSLYREELAQLNRQTAYGVRKEFLFIYYLDREDPKAVQPRLLSSLELADDGYLYDLEDPKDFPFINQRFRVSENILAVSKKRLGKFEFEFYDMEKSRNGQPNLIYNIDNISSVAVLSFADNHEKENFEEKCYEYFFEENYFIFSRDNSDGICVEIHEISSKKCTLVRKIELQTNFGPFDDLYIENIGRYAWNLYTSAGRTRETKVDQISTGEIIFFDMKKKWIAKKENRQNSNNACKMHEIIAKVESQLIKELVHGHVRLHENYTHENKTDEEDYELHVSL